VTGGISQYRVLSMAAEAYGGLVSEYMSLFLLRKISNGYTSDTLPFDGYNSSISGGPEMALILQTLELRDSNLSKSV
jgi:hypothetical protein